MVDCKEIYFLQWKFSLQKLKIVAICTYCDIIESIGSRSNKSRGNRLLQ